MPGITRIVIDGVSVPLVGEFASASGAGQVQRSIVLRVEDAAGGWGLGNCDPSPGYSTESVEDGLLALRDRLAPAVLRRDPANVHGIAAAMAAAMPGFQEAKAALEMACVDLAARRAGVAVHGWLGGAVRDRLLLNGWIGLLPPERAAAEAVAAQAAGFRSAKVKVGGTLASDVARVRAVREAVGADFRIRVDGNTSYDVPGAIRLAEALAPLDLELLEQPVEDIAGLAALRRAARANGLRIMADESVTDHASLIEIIRRDAADLVKLKAMKQGGLLATRRMIETAAAAGLPCVIGHGFGLGVNTIAELMLSASSANVIAGLECVGPLKTADDIIERRLDFSAGSVPLPHGPGLGCEADPAKLARYRFAAAEVRA